MTSRQELQQMAANAGFTGSSQQIITAIALAESGGNPLAHNPNDPAGGSFGILQINGVHFGSGTTQACALDPQCAMNYAFKLSNGGTNFSPWSTFTSGAYQQYLSGNAALPSIGGGGPQTVTLGFDPLSGITSLFSSLFGAKTDKQSLLAYWSNPLRVIKIVIGGVLIIVSLGMAIYGLAASDPVQAVAGAAENVPGVGGAASKVVKTIGQTKKKKGIVGKSVHVSREVRKARETHRQRTYYQKRPEYNP